MAQQGPDISAVQQNSHDALTQARLERLRARLAHKQQLASSASTVAPAAQTSRIGEGSSRAEESITKGREVDLDWQGPAASSQ